MMFPPHNFSWVTKPLLGAMACPQSREDLGWLRDQGVEILVTLTEDAIRRDWIEDAGLLSVHVPVTDFSAPSAEQLERCVSTIQKANERGMGVAIHCAAGRGRTGTVLAAYLVAERGLPADDAIAQVRDARPGSIETDGQEEAVRAFAARVQLHKAHGR